MCVVGKLNKLKFKFRPSALRKPSAININTCYSPSASAAAAAPSIHYQVYYFIVDSPRNEGKEFFEINMKTGEVFTKIVFDREKQGAYALEVEARDGAPSARPNSDNQPNSGKSSFMRGVR